MREISAQVAPVSQFQEVAPGVLVKSRRTVFKANGVIEFTDGVEAIYDVTTVTADRLTVHTGPGEQFGVAEGNVRVVDPVGVMTARSLKFNWLDKTGEALGVEARSMHALVRAERLTIQPKLWEAHEATVSPCDRDIPILSFRATKVALTVGRGGTAFKPSVYVGKQKLGTLPTQKFSLDRRTTGFRLPGISLRGQDVGISWSRGFLLDDQTSLELGFNSFSNSKPGYEAAITRSWVDAEKSVESIVPKSELSERFATGWLERVRVRNPGAETRALRAPKDGVAFTTSWNRGANQSARSGGGNFGKLIEATYEKGGGFGWGAGVGQVRLQTIREGDNNFHFRGIFSGGVGLTDIPLGKGLDFRARFDASAYVGNDLFGWVRGSAGFAYLPIPQVRFGAAYIFGGQTGNPLFEADRLARFNAVHVRADADLGPTKLSYLMKYDLSTQRLFDREYMFSQIVGCLEPFVMFRQVPNDYVWGIRLRSTQFSRLLQQRKPKRPTPTPVKTVISAPKSVPVP